MMPFHSSRSQVHNSSLSAEDSAMDRIPWLEKCEQGTTVVRFRSSQDNLPPCSCLSSMDKLTQRVILQIGTLKQTIPGARIHSVMTSSFSGSRGHRLNNLRPF